MNVEQFAAELKVSAGLLIEQLKSAGVAVSSEQDLLSDQDKASLLEYLRDNMLVTTSGNWYEPAFVCTLLALGVDKILFAIDWPYEANTTGMEYLHKLSISDADREKIAHGNAERILRM